MERKTSTDPLTFGFDIGIASGGLGGAQSNPHH